MATATSASSIALSWTPALGTLSRADGTTLVTVVPNPDGSVPSGSYTDSGLQPGTTYSYSFSPSDTTFASGSASATTPPVGAAPTPTPTPSITPTPVPPPTGGGGGGGGGGGVVPTPTPAPCKITLTADNETAHSIHLKWTKCSDSDFVSYKLYRSSDPNFTPDDSTHLDRGADETQQAKVEYTDTGLAPSTAYTYILVIGHAGTTTQASATDKTIDLDTPSIKFDGLARACAGGIGVDGVHSFTITGTATRDDGTGTGNTTLVTGTDFKLSFDANKGHDYSGDDPSLWPKPDWTTDDIKKAKFVTGYDANGNPILDETLTVHTDSTTGQFSVTVVSSDIVSSDIKVKLKWTNSNGDDKDAGSQACDFAEAAAKRRFPNQYDPDEVYPEGDIGWLFHQSWLSYSGAETTGKIYLKFMIDPTVGDVDGNWKEVNGHQMLFEIDSVTPKAGTQPAAKDDYGVVVPTQNGLSLHKTADNGAATTIVRAGTKITDAETMRISVYDESQWAG